jgi:hypothetical protein
MEKPSPSQNLPEGMRIRIDRYLVVGRPFAPFESAAHPWPLLRELARTLDRGFSTHVESVAVSSDGTAILFTIGATAFAISHRVHGFTGYRGLTAAIDDAHFPIDASQMLQTDAELLRWINRTRDENDDYNGQMTKYKGPRLFGDNVLIDEVLPVILQGCQLL